MGCNNIVIWRAFDLPSGGFGGRIHRGLFHEAVMVVVFHDLTTWCVHYGGVSHKVCEASYVCTMPNKLGTCRKRIVLGRSRETMDKCDGKCDGNMISRNNGNMMVVDLVKQW